MIKLILFDIDGTLINPGRVGRRSLTATFHELFSVQDAFSDITMAGKTDIQIIKEALTAHGLASDDGVIPKILTQYVNILRSEINTGRMSLEPGVIELLNDLKANEGFRLGLLTGNIEQGARLKLSAFDLNRQFLFGGFGDDNEDRNKLLPIAVEKFRNMTNIDIGFSDCVVIGDTPMDIECSSPFGAISVAVSTGPFSFDALVKAGADFVLEDLTQAKDLRLFYPDL
jgi:phosphoglycolate phosphatase